MSEAVVVAFSNTKGGANKSSATASMGVTLANRGYRVLVIDADSNADLTVMMCVETDPDTPNIGDLCYYPPLRPAYDVIVPAPFDLPRARKRGGSLYLLPAVESSFARGMANIAAEGLSGNHYLSTNLAPLKNVFDWILVDTSPNRERIKQSMFVFADLVVGTVNVESELNIKHVGDTEVAVRGMSQVGASSVQYAGTLVTRFDKRGTDAKRNLELIKALGEVCPTLIPTSNDMLKIESVDVVPLMAYRRKHKVTIAYDDASKWLISRTKALLGSVPQTQAARERAARKDKNTVTDNEHMDDLGHTVPTAVAQ